MSVYDYLIPQNVTTKQITEAPELKAFQARDTSKLRTKFLFLSQYVSSIIAFYKLQWGGWSLGELFAGQEMGVRPGQVTLEHACFWTVEESRDEAGMQY